MAAEERDGRAAGMATTAAAPPPHGVVGTVHGLVECCKGVEHGMRAWSARAQRHDLKDSLLQRAESLRAAAHELTALVGARAARAPDDRSDAGGSILRGSLATEGALSHTDDAAVLNECEHALDDAVVRYRSALEQPLPEGIRQVVRRQCDDLLRQHDEIRTLRETVARNP